MQARVGFRRLTQALSIATTPAAAIHSCVIFHLQHRKIVPRNYLRRNRLAKRGGRAVLAVLAGVVWRVGRKRPTGAFASPQAASDHPTAIQGVPAERWQSPVVSEVVSNFGRSWSLLTAPEHWPLSRRRIFTPNQQVLKSPFSRAFEHC